MRILRETREKQNSCTTEPTVRLSDFTNKTFQGRRDWDDIFKIMKEKKNLSARVVCQTMLPSRNEVGITFRGKNKW